MSLTQIKVGKDFLNNIKFDKEYYLIYNNIFNNKLDFTEEIFIYFILQVAYQNNFNGYLDELYTDVIKRKPDYIKQLIKNFKESYIGEIPFNTKFRNFFCFVKPTEKEIQFTRGLTIFEFDKIFDDFFELKNEDKKNKFIAICTIIYDNKIKQILQRRSSSKLNQKNKKKVSFSSVRIYAV